MDFTKSLDAFGFIELSSIAAGIEATDTMLKTADVQLLISRTICSGKYMVAIGGMVADVRASVDAGISSAEGSVIDSMVIPHVHQSIFFAIAGTSEVTELASLGVIESFSVASLIEAADTAVKTADVQLLSIQVAMALGGKAFVTMTGEVSAVRSAVDAGAEVVAKKGLLVNKAVIPAPRPELYKDYI